MWWIPGWPFYPSSFWMGVREQAQHGPGSPQGQAESMPPSQPGAGQPGIRHFPGDGTGPRRRAQFGGRGELETGPAAACLGQGLMAPGCWDGVLGRVGGTLGRDSQAHEHPWGPDRGLSSQQDLPSHLTTIWVQPRTSLAVPKQDRARGGGQVQPRSQTIRQHCGDDQVWNQTGKSSHRSWAGSGPVIAGQAWGGSGSHPTSWSLTQKAL